jgi:hypothetical protein
VGLQGPLPRPRPWLPAPLPSYPHLQSLLRQNPLSSLMRHLSGHSRSFWSRWVGGSSVFMFYHLWYGWVGHMDKGQGLPGTGESVVAPQPC